MTRMQNAWTFLLTASFGLLAAFGIGNAAAQEVGLKVVPPQLLFSAKLSPTTRGEFQSQGQIEWKKDRALLSPSSSLSRELNTGCWLETEIDLTFGGSKDRPRSTELQMQFRFDRDGEWVLSWRQLAASAEDPSSTDPPERCELLLRREVPSEEQSGGKYEVIRRWPLQNLQSGTWRVCYRQGLIEVSPPKETANKSPSSRPSKRAGEGTKDAFGKDTSGKDTSGKDASGEVLAPFAAHAKNADAAVQSIAVAVKQGQVDLTSWRLSAAPFRDSLRLSEEQLAEMKKATAMNSQMIKLFRAGKPLEAIKLAIQVRETTQRILGKAHPRYSQSINNLAAMTQAVGKLREAGPLYQEAVAIREAIYGKQHPTYGRSLNNYAALKRSIGDTQSAIRLTKEALQIFERVIGKEDRETATLLNNLAELYRYSGHYSKAEPYYLESRAIYERITSKKSADYARLVANLASLFQEVGDLAAAEPLCIEARDIQLELLGKDHPAYASSLNNLAALNQTRGHYARAEPLYLESIDIIRRAYGDKHPGYASSLVTLSGLYRAMGDFARAEAPLLEAKKIQEQTLGPDHVRYADTLLGLARLYDLMEQTDEAERRFLQASDIYARKLGKDHSRYTVAQNSLALLYEARGDYGLAEPIFVEAQKRLQRQKRTGHSDYSGLLLNLANLRHSIGDSDGAEPLYVEARDIAKRVMGDGHPDAAMTMNWLARHYETKDDLARAEPLFQEAVDVLVKAAEDAAPRMSEAQAIQWLQHRTPRTDMVLANLRQQGKFDGLTAYRFVWRTKALMSRLRVNSRLGKNANAQAQQVNGELRDARLKLARMVSAKPSPSQAERFRASLAAANDAKEQLEKKLASLNPATKQALAIRDASVQQLIEQLPAGVAVIDFVYQTDWRVGEKVVTVRRQGRPEETRKVKAHASRKVYDAFVLRPDAKPNKQVVWQPLGLAEPIDQAIVAWRRRLTGGKDDRGLGATSVKIDPNKRAKRPAALLRDKLWAPIEPHLRDCHTIIVLPDAGLHRLPWAALPGRKPDSYLIEDYALGAAAYGQQLYGLLKQSAPEGNTLLVAGGIQYDRRSQKDAASHSGLLASARRPAATRGDQDRGWAFLPGAAKEAQTVLETWNDSSQATQLSGVQANESALARQLPQSRFAHLATHGFFAAPEVKNMFHVDLRQQTLFAGQAAASRTAGSAAGRNPLLLCGVVVAGANLRPLNDELGVPTGDDGILTAEELAGLPLHNTELITLSACDTGLGDVAAGEGVFGLQRALHQAGARSVVASLWRVDDQATRALMAEFYKGLWKDELGKLAALRQAQLAILNRYDLKTGAVRGLGRKSVQGGKPSKSKRTDPRYWAAFQLSGDWR